MGSVLLVLIIGFIYIYILVEKKKKKKREEEERKDRIEQILQKRQEERTHRTELKRHNQFVKLKEFDALDTKKVKALSDYIVLDLETTGLNKSEDKIIEVGIIVVQNSVIIEQYQTLVNPEMHIPECASEINGIFDKDVKNAPQYAEIIDKLKGLLCDKIVLGYNVTFDLGFIESIFNQYEVIANITYLDVLPYAKRIIKGLPNYKLKTVSEHLKISQKPNHRALDDAIATNQVFCACIQELERQEEAAKQQRKVDRERKKAEHTTKYRYSPLLDVAFVFTGEFSIDRTAIETLADSVGGLIRAKVTSNTDYLVVGKLENLPDWAIERKYKKAKELQTMGKKIKLIDESQYLSMIATAKSELELHESKIKNV